MNQFQLIIILLVFFVYKIVGSQNINVTVIDKESEEPIPYALVTFGKEKGMSANGDGYFEIELPNNIKEIDSLEFISIGYKGAKYSLKEITEIPDIVQLERDVVAMNEVVISNTSYNLEEILDKVEANISTNYSVGVKKKSIFFRQHDTNKINNLEIQFKKSTIPEINQEFVNKELNQIPKSSSFYTEVLAGLYNNTEYLKLDIQKAVKFYDTYSNNYLDVFNTRLEEILNRNFKKDSYFKIKSGFFSIKTDGKGMFSEDGELLDMRNEISKKEEVNRNFFFNNTKKVIKSVLSETFYNEDSSLNFIDKKNRYNFELVDTIVYGDDIVYQISFFPNGREDFKGTFYVNTSDFAIVRIDYQNVARLRNIKLLGLSYQELGRKGTIIFEKNDVDNYELKLIEQVQEDKYGIDRPLKIIEKNKNVRGRRKQNEISSEIDFVSTVIRKFQILVYDTQEITGMQFQNQSENKDEQPKNWIKYYPDFWKGFPNGESFKNDFKEIKSLK